MLTIEARGGDVGERGDGVELTHEQRIHWLRLIRSPNIGPRGIMAQTVGKRLNFRTGRAARDSFLVAFAP
jgi:hypothetical protein